jgi:hypothetical protein
VLGVIAGALLAAVLAMVVLLHDFLDHPIRSGVGLLILVWLVRLAYATYLRGPVADVQSIGMRS